MAVAPRRMAFRPRVRRMGRAGRRTADRILPRVRHPRTGGRGLGASRHGLRDAMAWRQVRHAICPTRRRRLEAPRGRHARPERRQGPGSDALPSPDRRVRGGRAPAPRPVPARRRPVSARRSGPVPASHGRIGGEDDAYRIVRHGGIPAGGSPARSSPWRAACSPRSARSSSDPIRRGWRASPRSPPDSPAPDCPR